MNFKHFCKNRGSTVLTMIGSNDPWLTRGDVQF